MRIIPVCFILTLIALFTPSVLTEEEKLQIGVKLRNECKSKSKNGDRIYVHYTGTLTDGTEFDSSLKRKLPFDFVLGQGKVIRGWDQGLINRCPGDKIKLKIPPNLGYGQRGSPPTIPANAHLIFDIQVVSVKSGQDAGSDL
ncbi:FK506-binding protein 2A [Coelomomyces lativittatus]|nr:FK506-binding protein 2A [Coelomomyces lativittatus]KAJ1514446.1 FK506-binding protein 2A [Coelomomyces lativittatus]KAJ1516485.1 FK506-binding protein 2A [Coelomomyces lativittatus]